MNLKRQTRIFVPLTEPFNTAQWAETVIGGIIAPVVSEKEQGLEWFWFSRYDCTARIDSADCDINKIPREFMDSQSNNFKSVRFRYSIEDKYFKEFEEHLKNKVLEAGCSVSDFRDYDFLGDLGSNRHIGGERIDERKQQRAYLVAKLYDAISRIVIHALTGPDDKGIYRIEHNDDKQNPLGSSFETLHHLFCNITAVPTRVLISQMGVGTDWSAIQNVIQEVRVRF